MWVRCFVRKDTVKKVDGLEFELFGRGSTSLAFGVCLEKNTKINGVVFPAGTTIVYKELREDEESPLGVLKEEQAKKIKNNKALNEWGARIALDQTERLIRLWNEFNDDLPFLAQPLGRGYIVPFVVGTVPSNEEIIDFCLDAYTNHHYQEAINYWQQLLKLAPEQSEEAPMIRRAIAKAQQALS